MKLNELAIIGVAGDNGCEAALPRRRSMLRTNFTLSVRVV